MTDAQQSSTDPTANTSLPPSDKDPLAILEELLAKQKASGGQGVVAGDGGVGGGDQANAPVADQTQTEAAQKAASQAEYDRMLAESEARDAQLIAEQETAMAAIKDSPQYQARISQNEEKKHEAEEHASAGDGYAINQLTTKKVALPDDGEQPTV